MSLPPDVFAKNQWMELTRGDYDAALAKLPAKRRWDFATSPTRLRELLNGLLVTKTLAAQARAHGLDAGSLASEGAKSPRRAYAVERALANAELKRIDDDAGNAFDAKKLEFEAKAREALHGRSRPVPEARGGSLFGYRGLDQGSRRRRCP